MAKNSTDLVTKLVQSDAFTILPQKFIQLLKDATALRQVVHTILKDPATLAKTKELEIKRWVCYLRVAVLS